MLKSFKIWPPSDSRAVLRLLVGLLLAANLVAGYFLVRPIGGSPQELRQQAADMQTQIRQKRNLLARTRDLVSKIETGRGEGDHFLGQYFLPRRNAYSMIVADLNDLAGQAKVTPKESAFAVEPVDGSETLLMMQVTANFETTYQDLIHFVNLLDKSQRLLVIESLNATPQQGGAKLNVMLKLDTFVTEDAAAQ